MEFIATCIDYTYDGKGVVKYLNTPVFIDYLIINEKAKIKVIKEGKSFHIGQIVEILEPSVFRGKSKCNIFKQCGGCHLMHMTYEGQLDFKRRAVENSFRSIAKINTKVEDTIGMEDPWFYRNKIQVPVGINREGQLIAGFYGMNTHKIVPFSKCYLQKERANEIIKIIIDLMKKFRIAPYDEDKMYGTVRHLYLRIGENSKEVILVLVIAVLTFPASAQFVKAITEACPDIVSVVFNFNFRKTNVILGPKEKVVYGPGFIKDTLLDYKFKISAKSFYQVNSKQTEVLYSKAIELAGFTKDDIVLDAYSGIGTISLALSKHVKKVISIEIVEEAIKDGIQNAKINNIDNITFIVGDVKDKIQEIKKLDITGLVIDPPRKGCDKEFIAAIKEIAPAKIIYISCDHGTLARDLTLFQEKYTIISINPLDMFPFTYHVETCVVLSKKN